MCPNLFHFFIHNISKKVHIYTHFSFLKNLFKKLHKKYYHSEIAFSTKRFFKKFKKSTAKKILQKLTQHKFSLLFCSFTSKNTRKQASKRHFSQNQPTTTISIFSNKNFIAMLSIPLALLLSGITFQRKQLLLY